MERLAIENDGQQLIGLFSHLYLNRTYATSSKVPLIRDQAHEKGGR